MPTCAVADFVLSKILTLVPVSRAVVSVMVPALAVIADNASNELSNSFFIQNYF